MKGYWSVNERKWSVDKCSEVYLGEVWWSVFRWSVVMFLVIRCQTLLEDVQTIWSCCLYVFYEYYYHNIFFINVYMVLFLFNNVIYVFYCMPMFSHCMFMYDYPDWGFSVFFSQLQGKCRGKTRTARTLSSFCVDLCIVCFVSFSVYCLCVYVYCTTATGWLPNWS
jgi:hypothetical protein